ncbi:MAG: hypothetical protein K2Q06_14140 [Parvularculaceae bacterium]|nr:hypothetical protein [Parvularculaceae bacterium]
MSDLESSAKSLADALDALEMKLDQRLHDLADSDEARAMLMRQTRAAHDFTTGAAEDLARVIADLKALLGEHAYVGGEA